MELNKADKIYSRVYLKILNFLSFSKRSTNEITDKIGKYLFKEHIPLREKEIIKDKVISNLKSDGYIKETTDYDYSILYLDSLKKSPKPFNAINIRRFLSKKGISEEIIADVLENLDESSVYESVLKDAKKKLKYMPDNNVYLKKKKLTGYLYRKGYPFDVVSSVVDTLM